MNVAPSEHKLPADLLHLLCIELAERKDFSTLYRCAVTSKTFAAAGALSSLYKICDLSPVTGGEYEGVGISVAELLVRKWSILWRTIVLSALDETMYPYARYMRVLDLRDLNFLLEDDKFRRDVLQNFFAGPLDRFRIMTSTPFQYTRSKRQAAPRLKAREIMLAVGDVVIPKAVMLEVITEPVAPGLEVLSDGLVKWPPYLANLQSLQLGDGVTLASDDVQELLLANCPQLNKLEIFRWLNSDQSDHHLARFLGRMPADMLTSFQNESSCGIRDETCKALAHHAKSLTTLSIAVDGDGISGLPFLHPCTSLEVLTLTDLRPPHDLQTTQNDIFTELVAWLPQCTRLKHLTLNNFLSAPALLTPLLRSPSIKLEHLQINASENSLYLVKDHKEFHQALSNQTSLTSLLLKADAEGAFRDDNEVLCECLCALKNLKRLSLTRVTENFSEPHVNLLAENLPVLEELLVDGYGITDNCLLIVANLGHLKSLTFSGLTSFTTSGLLDFVGMLSPGGHQGFALSVDRAVTEAALTESEVDLVSETIAASVGGRFEYQLHRDPDVSDSAMSDSD